MNKKMIGLSSAQDPNEQIFCNFHQRWVIPDNRDSDSDSDSGPTLIPSLNPVDKKMQLDVGNEHTLSQQQSSAYAYWIIYMPLHDLCLTGIASD